LRDQCDFRKETTEVTSSSPSIEATEVVYITMTVPSDPKIDGFEVIQTSYKKIEDHGIRCDILIPKAKHEGKRPVIINFHDGGLVCTSGAND